MKAQDIMTSDVATIAPGTTVDAAARLLVERRISALPVVTEDGALVGLVSESDMIHRAETDTTRKRKWWLEIFVDNDERAREFIKSHARTIDDVMTTTVVTVDAEAGLGEVADVLDVHKIRRVPVVRDGRLAGIISRSDLVRALAETQKAGDGRQRSDYELRKEVFAAIRKQSWLNSVNINLDVKDGVVEVLGFVEGDDDKEALRVLIEGISGVKKVVNSVQKQTWKTAS